MYDAFSQITLIPSKITNYVQKLYILVHTVALRFEEFAIKWQLRLGCGQTSVTLLCNDNNNTIQILYITLYSL